MDEKPVYRRGVRVGWRTRFESEAGFYERIQEDDLGERRETSV